MKTVGEFIRARREEKDLSARELAYKAGVSDGHIIYLEKGQRKPTLDIMMKILRALAADVQEFLQETGYVEANPEPASLGRLSRIPIISWVLAGKWAEGSGSFNEEEVEEWIESDTKGKNLFALRVKGDSMEPEFRDGDIIIVNPHIKPVHNDYVVLKNEEDEAVFKQLKKYGKARILHPLNPNYPDIELSDKHQYRIIGKVVEKKKRY
jgi:SOS-response transcriptional repressor LexA